jgi:plasmid stabilization system protein ParE
MTERFTITYHSEAGDDFDLIDEFIAAYAGETAASKVIDEIRSTISKLTDFPRIGTVRNEIVPGLRALPSAGKATICFTVNDETHTVKIVCVTYAGQDWQQIAKSREQTP